MTKTKKSLKNKAKAQKTIKTKITKSQKNEKM